MGVAPPEAHSMQMVGPWGRYLPQWLRAPCKGSGPARSTQYADGRTLGYISTPVVKGALQREWPRQKHTACRWYDPGVDIYPSG